MQTKYDNSLSTHSEENPILNFVRKHAENKRLPYAIFMVVYLLITRKIDMKPSFLDSFDLEDDESFSYEVRQLIKEVQILLSLPSLEKKQQIENILAALLPNYQKQNLLALTTRVFCSRGLPFFERKAKNLDNNAITGSQEQNTNFLTDLIKSHKANPSIEKTHSELKLAADLTLSSALAAYKNPELADLDDALVEFLDSLFLNSTLTLAFLDLMQLQPQHTMRLERILDRFFAENFLKKRDYERYKSYCITLSKIFEIYPDLVGHFKKPEFFEKLFAKKAQGSTLLDDLVSICDQSDCNLLNQLFFYDNEPSPFLNFEFMQALQQAIFYNPDQRDFSVLNTLLTGHSGRNFIEKLFAIKPDVFGYLSADSFYRPMVSLYDDNDGCSTFSILLLNFYTAPKTDALIFSFFRHNSTLIEHLSYRDLCSDLVLKHKRTVQCTGLGLLLAHGKEQELGINWLTQVIVQNPAILDEITAQDLCKEQKIDGEVITVLGCLEENEPGQKFLNQLLEYRPEMREEIEKFKTELVSEKEAQTKDKPGGCRPS